MKSTLIILITLFMAISAMPQKLVNEKKVPEKVKKSFKKKASQASEAKWFALETVYTVKYYINEKEGQMEIDTSGKILSTKTEIIYDKLPTQAKIDLEENHRKKKIEIVYYIEKSKKDKYYSVIALEKRGRKEEPAKYEIQYDTQGKLITIFEPEEAPIDDEDEGGEEEISKEEEEMDEEID